MLPVDSSFTKRLPKVELHAHLTGSISRQCLHEIWHKKVVERKEDLSLEDPLITLPDGKADFDVKSFFPVFTKCIYILIDDLKSVAHSTNAVLRDFADDGVCYLELRTTPRKSGKMTKDEYISTILDCIEQSNKTSMSTFLILSIDRKNTANEAIEVADLAIKYQNRGVVGLDLCGDPSRACNVSDFAPAFTKAKSSGLGLTLHFAETSESSSSDELNALLSFEPARLGHVIHTDTDLKSTICQKQICLEMCLSCNIRAKLTEGGFEKHHFGDWWKREDRGPIALCTDDIGIFLSPLSNEYLLAADYFGLNRQDILKLCNEAADAIFAGRAEKARIKKLLFEEWSLLNDV